MAISRKDFEAIARAFNNAANADRSGPRLWALETAAHFVAIELAALNPRFKRDRFMRACNVVDEARP